MWCHSLWVRYPVSQCGKERYRRSFWAGSFPKGCWLGFGLKYKPCDNKQGTKSSRRSFHRSWSGTYQYWTNKQPHVAFTASQETWLSEARDLWKRKWVEAADECNSTSTCSLALIFWSKLSRGKGFLFAYTEIYIVRWTASHTRRQMCSIFSCCYLLLSSL